MTDSSFRVGPWRVRPRLLRIDRDSERHALRPKVMALLRALADHPGRVVRKDEILERVWEGTVVSDEVLRRTVFELRQAFGDDPRAPRYVETIPRVGYRLIAPVTKEAKETKGAIGEPQGSDGDRRRLLPLLAAGAALLAAAAAASWLLRDSDSSALSSLEGDPASESAGGLELRPITTLPGVENYPALSRDGRRLAFTATGEDGVSNLFFLELDAGGVPIRLTDDEALQGDPTFDPDGRRLAYFHDPGVAPEVRIRDLESGDDAHLFELPTASLYDLAWSPDGKWLAAAVRSRPAVPVAVHLYSFAAGELKPLTAPPADHDGDTELAWSPDAETLAFVRIREWGDADLHTVGLGGEPTLRRVTRLSTILLGGGFNRSGDALFFARYQPGRNSLWRVEVAGGAPRPVAELSEQPMALAVAAGGPRLVLSEVTYQTNVWRLALDQAAAQPEPLISSTAYDGSPAVSPDGRRVAFLSDRTGFVEIWIAAADGTSPRQLTSFAGPLLQHPRWAPGGDRLAVEVYSGTGSDIYLVPLEGEPEPLTDHPARDALPAFSAAGDALYFASNRGGDWQIWRRPLAGGPPSPVTEDGGYRCLDLGSGGLVFSRKRRSYLYRLDDAGGVPQILADLGQRGGLDSWALAGDDLYHFRLDGPGGPDLVRRRLGSDEVESLVLVKYTVVDPEVNVSPDGRYLLWTSVDHYGSDLKLLEGFTGL